MTKDNLNNFAKSNDAQFFLVSFGMLTSEDLCFTDG